MFQLNNMRLIGGKSVSDCICRFMPTIIVNDIVELISGRGKVNDSGVPKLASMDSLKNLKK